MPLKKVKQKTVVDQVMDQIKELIASGEYKPGDKIPTEMELAKDFGLGVFSLEVFFLGLFFFDIRVRAC